MVTVTRRDRTGRRDSPAQRSGGGAIDGGAGSAHDGAAGWMGGEDDDAAEKRDKLVMHRRASCRHRWIRSMHRRRRRCGRAYPPSSNAHVTRRTQQSEQNTTYASDKQVESRRTPKCGQTLRCASNWRHPQRTHADCSRQRWPTRIRSIATPPAHGSSTTVAYMPHFVRRFVWLHSPSVCRFDRAAALSFISAAFRTRRVDRRQRSAHAVLKSMHCSQLFDKCPSIAWCVDQRSHTLAVAAPIVATIEFQLNEPIAPIPSPSHHLAVGHG